MSYYGCPRAICTPYGDLVFCISCAMYIYEHKTNRDEIYHFLRHINHNEIEQVSKYQWDETVKDFASLVYQDRVPSWLGSDLPMLLLREGMANEQDILDQEKCDCCQKRLKDFCVDY